MQKKPPEKRTAPYIDKPLLIQFFLCQLLEERNREIQYQYWYSRKDADLFFQFRIRLLSGMLYLLNGKPGIF